MPEHVRWGRIAWNLFSRQTERHLGDILSQRKRETGSHVWPNNCDSVGGREKQVWGYFTGQVGSPIHWWLEVGNHHSGAWRGRILLPYLSPSTLLTRIHAIGPSKFKNMRSPVSPVPLFSTPTSQTLSTFPQNAPPVPHHLSLLSTMTLLCPGEQQKLPASNCWPHSCQ